MPLKCHKNNSNEEEKTRLAERRRYDGIIRVLKVKPETQKWPESEEKALARLTFSTSFFLN